MNHQLPIPDVAQDPDGCFLRVNLLHTPFETREVNVAARLFPRHLAQRQSAKEVGPQSSEMLPDAAPDFAVGPVRESNPDIPVRNPPVRARQSVADETQALPDPEGPRQGDPAQAPV